MLCFEFWIEVEIYFDVEIETDLRSEIKIGVHSILKLTFKWNCFKWTLDRIDLVRN